ncbi:MAG: hypothetical protein LBB81_01235 [Treponema sp.]|jgi:hypothetical protein|nr:hypothetical protein [Treponema sp.]
MDEKHIFGKRAMGMPNLNTLKILEDRRIYLIKKVQNNMEYNNDKNGYSLNEIAALEKTMNFIKWIINNSSNDIVQGTIEKYKFEIKMMKDKNDEEETAEETVEEVEKEKGIFKGSLQEEFSKKLKLEITVTEYNKENYISLEQMRLKQDMITWQKTGKIRMTLHKMEKIIKGVYDILIDNKSKNNLA